MFVEQIKQQTCHKDGTPVSDPVGFSPFGGVRNISTPQVRNIKVKITVGRKGVRTGSRHAPGSAELMVGAHLDVLPTTVFKSLGSSLLATEASWREGSSRRKEVGAGEQGPFPPPKDFPAVLD